MPGAGTKATRPWQIVAEEVARESDPEKLTRLLEELNRALDEQCIKPRSGRSNLATDKKNPTETGA